MDGTIRNLKNNQSYQTQTLESQYQFKVEQTEQSWNKKMQEQEKRNNEVKEQ